MPLGPKVQNSQPIIEFCIFNLGGDLIENADATPPHLDVFVRLGSSSDLPGSLQFLCKGGAQPVHDNTLPNDLKYNAKANQNIDFGEPEAHF